MQSDNPTKTLETYLDSLMAIEFIRVEDDDELVIIGLDYGCKKGTQRTVSLNETAEILEKNS